MVGRVAVEYLHHDACVAAVDHQLDGQSRTLSWVQCVMHGDPMVVYKGRRREPKPNMECVQQIAEATQAQG